MNTHKHMYLVMCAVSTLIILCDIHTARVSIAIKGTRAETSTELPELQIEVLHFSLLYSDFILQPSSHASPVIVI